MKLRGKWVPKGWGGESWVVNNESYCGKILLIKKGFRVSWHYHKLKDETFFCQKGKLLLFHSWEDCLLSSENCIKVFFNSEFKKLLSEYIYLSSWIYPTCGEVKDMANCQILEKGDIFHVPVGLRHAMFGLKDTELIEFSTHHEDSDSYRVLKGD
jgi:quercetin dioxygenase-like cupin family protein